MPPEQVTATWYTDGSGAWIEDSDGASLAQISIAQWHEPGDRKGVDSWIASYTVIENDRPMPHQRRLEPGPAERATDEARKVELTQLAIAAAEQGPTEPPPPLVLGFGDEDEQVIRQIQMLHSGWGEASHRVQDASRDTTEWASVRLHRSLTEALLWVRLADDVLGQAWRAAPVAAREDASLRTDRWLSRLLKAEPHRTGSTAAFRAYANRQLDGKPYRDWATAAIGRGAETTEEDLESFRWLAGKLLHLAPRPVTELRQWRPGVEPRWKWRDAEAIFPQDQEKHRHHANRAVYQSHLAGRDVVGSMNLTMTFIETEYMFIGLYKSSRPAKK